MTTPTPKLTPNPSPVGRASSPSSCATHRHFPKSRPLTIEQLTDRLDHWQQQLCLSHWVIDVELERDKRIGDALGRCNYLLSKHRATILLMDPGDWLDEYDSYDMEQVLVHELLHLHFAPWLDWSLEQAEMTDLTDAICFEQPVERLSWILIELDRANALYKGNSHEMATMNAELLDEQTALNTKLDELTTLLDHRTQPNPSGTGFQPVSLSLCLSPKAHP